MRKASTPGFSASRHRGAYRVSRLTRLRAQSGWLCITGAIVSAHAPSVVEPSFATTSEQGPGVTSIAASTRHIESCEIPRVECPEHGVHQLPVPCADSNATLTALFRVCLIQWLKEMSASAVARHCRLSFSSEPMRSRRVLTVASRRSTHMHVAIAIANASPTLASCTAADPTASPTHCDLRLTTRRTEGPPPQASGSFLIPTTVATWCYPATHLRGWNDTHGVDSEGISLRRGSD